MKFSFLALSLPLIATALPARAQAFEHHHAIATGFAHSFVAADSGGEFNFYSIPVTYQGRYGGKIGGAFRLTALVPLLAHQGDLSFFTGEHYKSYGGLDMFVGPTLRFEAAPGWELDVALGGHFNYMRLVSDVYVEWSSATAGFGAALAVRNSFSSPLWGGVPEWGMHFDISADVADFSRNGDLSVGIQSQLALSLGLGWGTQK